MVADLRYANLLFIFFRYILRKKDVPLAPVIIFIAQVGFGILDRVLARIDKPTNPSVVLGMGDDAALISTGSDKQAVATIDFIRCAFWA